MDIEFDTETLEMLKACYLYFDKGLKQDEIGEYLNKSTMTVSRLLKDARKKGVVETRINLPYPHKNSIERELSKLYPNSLDYLVLDRSYFSMSNLKQSLGEAAATYIPFLIKNGDHLGVGGGETLAQAVTSFPQRCVTEDITVVQLSGMLQPKIIPENPSVITQELCRKLSAEGYFYALPGSIEYEKSWKSNLLVKSVHDDLLSKWKNIDIGLVGIGEAKKTLTSLQLGHIDEEKFIHLADKGAAGDMLLHFFDEEGQLVDKKFDETVLGISWENLKEIPKVIAVAGGEKKVNAIRAAIRSGVVDLLITDDKTANNIIAQT